MSSNRSVGGLKELKSGDALRDVGPSLDRASFVLLNHND